MVPRVAVSGVPASLAEMHGWTFRRGVAPVVRRFVMLRAEAERLAATPNQPVTLELDDGRGQPLRVASLWPIGVAPHAEEELLGLLLADSRYWLTRRHIAIRANFPTDDMDADTPVILQTERPIAASTLDPSDDAWTPRRLLEVLLSRVPLPNSSSGIPFVVESFPADFAVYAFEADDRADSALLRVMGLVPDLDVWVDRAGTFRFFDAAASAANATRERGATTWQAIGLPPPIEGTEQIVEQIYANVRPSHVDVLFTPRLELRFDAVYGSTTVDSNDPLILEDAVRSPDEVELSGGRTVFPGEFAPRGEYLDAVGSDFHATVDDAAIRRHWLNPAWRDAQVRLSILADDASPARRLDSLRDSYRRVFQIKRATREKLTDLRPHRVTRFRAGSGRRRPTSVVWSPYAIQYASLVAGGGGGDLPPSVAYVDNVESTVTLGSDLDSLTPAPAALSILHPEQGILQIDYNLFVPQVIGRIIHPGIIQNRKGGELAPIPDPRQMDSRRRGALLQLGQLDDDHHVALILTATPAVPNSNARFYRRRLTSRQVFDLLPPGARGAPADGPPAEVRVPAGVAEALFRWNEDRRPTLVSILNTGTSNEDTGELFNEGDLVNLAEIRVVARAWAAAVYARLTPREEGTHVTHFSPALTPTRNIGEVSHEIGGDDGSGSGASALTIVRMETGVHARPDPTITVPEALRLSIRRAEAAALPPIRLG